MEYITIKETSKKWGIGERRIRTLINEGRIINAKKVGFIWFIPSDSTKPIDKRVSIINNIYNTLPNNYFNDIDQKLRLLISKRQANKITTNSLKENDILQWTYNSNAIEGNTLTLMETKVVFGGVTIGGKSLAEHLEAINHKEAIEYLQEMINKENKINIKNIKDLHYLILKGINPKYALVYRDVEVIISGALHIPPNHFMVSQLMDQLISNYHNWNSIHPLVRSAYLHGEFVKIHPFIDGNGRTARLIMNFEIMKDGYPPIIIKTEKKFEYYKALDKAATTNDYTDFIIILKEYLNESLDFHLKFYD